MRIVLLLFTLFAGTVSQYSLRVELSKETAQIGESMEAKCHVTQKGEGDFMVRWVKHIDGEEPQIAINNHVEEDFEKTGRYKVEIDEPQDGSKTYIFRLALTDVQPEDSGEIGCLIPTQNVAAFRNFTVYGPVTSIALTSRNLDGTHAESYTDAQNVTFNEDDKRRFYCLVNGSYPKPDVKIMIGDTDITDQFEEKSKINRGGASKTTALQKLSYDVTLKNENFEILYTHSSKRLECRATVPKSGLPTKSIGILVKLNEYKPKFQCETKMVAQLHQMDFEIRCPVRADPPIHNMQVYWLYENEKNKTLMGGQEDGHYNAIIEEVDEFEHIMILKIDRVFDQHFRKYFFEAENKLGTETHEVSLIEDPRPVGSGMCPMLSLGMLLISLMLTTMS